jgi:xanthine dehydrogenase large subunit
MTDHFPNQPTDVPIGGIAGGAGASVHHDSAKLHVTGRARFIDDLPEPPGLLHAALVISPHAHARILGIDAGAALALPGVAAVMSAADIPGVNDVAPIFSNEPVLAVDSADYAGQAVAAVAADSLAVARQAVKLVAVGYEKLTPILSIEDALAAESYVCAPLKLVRGDPDAALAAAPHRLSGRLETGGQDHFYLEGQIAMALPRDDGSLLVLSSTQHPTEVQHGVAHLLGLPFAAVTVEVRRMGGGFGGKESQATHIAGVAALLAQRTGRPVKLRLPRDDDMLVTGKRHDFLIDWQVGFDDDGRILGLDMRLATRGGNVADLTSSVLTRAVCHVDNCCYLSDVRISGFPCRTNTVSNTAFRGFGGPQGMIGTEVMLEQIARHTGRSIEQVRAVNLYGDAPRDMTPYGQPVEDNIVEPLLAKLARDAELPARRAAIDAFNRSSPVIRKGLAVFPLKFGISFNMPTLNQGGALINVYTDGSVHLSHGGTEMGQGLFVKVAQVVAEVFQIELDRIQISATSTDKVPNTSATAASAGSDLNGMAAHAAATELRRRMCEVAAPELGVAADAVRFFGGRVIGGDASLSFAEVAKLAWLKRVSLSATGFYRTPKIHWDQASMTGHPFFYFAYGAAASEVAIDTLTGEYRVLRTDIIHDCGRSLNPRIDRGQIEGAFVQGMGWLTTEELWWDPEGHLRTHAPSTYKIPGSRDVPSDLRVHLLDDSPNREPTIFRSKAVGEPPLMLGIAVWLALRDAVASLADHRLTVSLDAPATPERVLGAVDELRARMAAQPVERALAPAK